jgi:hypothetical protein
LPRKRVIDADGLYHDEELVDLLGERGLHLYIALWGIAEDWGGFEYLPKSISKRMGALDFTVRQVANYISKLESARKIIPFSAEGRKFYWLLNFKKHQPLNNPSLPQLPIPEWINYEVKKYKSGKQYAVYSVIPGRLPVGYQDITSRLRVGSRNRNETETETETKERQGASGPPPSEKRTYDEDREGELFQEYRSHLEEQCEVLLRYFQGKNGEAGGFNPMHFIARAKKAKIPIEVVKEVLDSMVRQKEKVNNPWGWITSVLESEYKEHNYAQALREHEERKRWGAIPEKLGRFFGG